MDNLFYSKVNNCGIIYKTRLNSCLPLCIGFGLNKLNITYSIDNIIEKLNMDNDNKMWDSENILNNNGINNICNLFNISIKIYNVVLNIKNDIAYINNDYIVHYQGKYNINIINLILYKNHFYYLDKFLENNIGEKLLNLNKFEYENNISENKCTIELLNFNNLYKLDNIKINFDQYNSTINNINDCLEKIKINKIYSLDKKTLIRKEKLEEKLLFIKYTKLSFNNFINYNDI
jgi:hypothetical protein